VLAYRNKNETIKCVIWDIIEDSIGQNIVYFTVNGCVGSTAKLRNDPDCGELYFGWKEIPFYLKDFKEI